MKKIFMIMLISTLFVGICGFTTSNSSSIEDLKNAVVNNVSYAPVNTVYGVIESTPEKYVVNTPFGKYDVEKKNGGFSCMGISAKVRSKKNNKYIVDSSLGNFVVDTKKCTITKFNKN